MRIARFAKGDGVAYGVLEGTGSRVTIAELYGHPFGVDPGGVRLTGNRYPLAEVRLLAPVLPSKVVAAGQLTTQREREQLKAAEEALDQCWDLLRQRRARREFGENPNEAASRPVTEVEGYMQ